MNTNDLASHVAAQTSATKATAEHMVGAVFSAISDALARDEPRPGAMAVSGSTATDCRSPFLTGTRGRDFFDMWNVRTCPFHARTLVSETPTEPSSNLLNVGDARHRAIGVPSESRTSTAGSGPDESCPPVERHLSYGRLPNVEPGTRASRRPDMKSAISVLEESLPGRRMRRSVAVRIRKQHERVTPVVTHQTRLVVSLGLLLVTMDAHSVAPHDHAT